MPAFELSTREFGQNIRSYVCSSWDMMDMYLVKVGLYDVADQVIVLEESCVLFEILR